MKASTGRVILLLIIIGAVSAYFLLKYSSVFTISYKEFQFKPKGFYNGFQSGKETVSSLPKGVYRKTFAYHLQTEECISDYLLQDIALGNGTVCDVFVLSFRSECKASNVPAHINYIDKRDITWTRGRNELYNYVMKLGYRYKYHVYLDDDVEIFFTDIYDKFAEENKIDVGTLGLVEKFLKSGHYEQDLRIQRSGKSAWRVLEETLLEHSPATSVINYILNDGFESRVEQRRRWPKLCGNHSKMSDVTLSFYIDTMLIAFHEDAIPLLFPMSPVGDGISWFLSAVYLMFRQRAILYRQCTTIWKLSVTNHLSRPYPRNPFPPNYLDLYFATPEGSKIRELVRERERKTMLFYGDGGKWKEIFFGDSSVCMAPIKFPLSKHYIINPR